MEGYIQSGELKIEDYLSVIKNQIDHDQKLFKYFENNKEIEKAKLVQMRLPLLMSEMEEGISVAKQQMK